MKRNIFALIPMLAFSCFSCITASASTDIREHRFKDGIYSVQADRDAEKKALASSKENVGVLIGDTRNSYLLLNVSDSIVNRKYIKLDDLLAGIEVGSSIMVLNIVEPFSKYCCGYGYWGYYDPFYWGGCFDPFYWDRWHRWYWNDPFYWDRWRWGPYYYSWGPWGPWGPWRPWGPDPWWPGYRPFPVHPVHPAGSFATAMRGGNHRMAGAGINRPVPGGRIRTDAVRNGTRTATARTATTRTATARTATGVTSTRTAGRASTSMTARPVSRATGTVARPATTARPVSRTTGTVARPTTTARPATRISAGNVSKTSGKNYYRNVNSNVRPAVNSSGTSSSYSSGSSSRSYSTGSRSYSRSSSYSSGSSSRSYSGGSHSYSGGSRSYSGGSHSYRGGSRSYSGGGGRR